MILTLLAAAFAFLGATGPGFDHQYAAYGALLKKHVKDARVDYRGLAADPLALDETVAAFGRVTAERERSWDRAERLAFWINGYNLFTLDAIVDRYPIRGGVFSRQPRNSIRQIDGVWTKLTWRAAGREVTLDGIEHGIIRKEFREPLIHFAVNCASLSCPPLREEPYTGSRLTEQLEDAARRYLASPAGVRIDGRTLRVSSIFKWYGEDFVARFAPSGPAGRRPLERAILGVLQRHAPAEVVALARDAGVRLAFLSYNWSLNDVAAAAGPP